MLRLGWTLLCSLLCFRGNAVQLSTRTGHIAIFSNGPLTDIAATNDQVAASLDPETGAFVYSVPIKSFLFRRRLMQTHFNDRYMESERFPIARFQGVLQGGQNPALTRDGRYEVTAVGTMAIHGVERVVRIPVQLIVVAGRVRVESSFVIRPEDYNIRIPHVLFMPVGSTVRVTVSHVLSAPGE